MPADLGPLLAAVTDEWERGMTIAERAGIDSRTAGPKLAALEREALVATSWTDKHGGVRLYRRGPNAPAVARPNVWKTWIREGDDGWEFCIEAPDARTWSGLCESFAVAARQAGDLLRSIEP